MNRRDTRYDIIQKLVRTIEAKIDVFEQELIIESPKVSLKWQILTILVPEDSRYSDVVKNQARRA